MLSGKLNALLFRLLMRYTEGFDECHALPEQIT